MKILKIRENKLKLSLSSEEAAAYGLTLHPQGPRELRAAVERIFADRRELFRIEEKIIVESYPKLDGSCEVFVTNVMGQSEGKEDNTRQQASLWGFCSIGHLALALYVLMLERERTGSTPLCERDEEEMISPSNELCAETLCPLSECYRTEEFTLGELVAYLREKTGNDRTQKLKEALQGAHIYKSERMGEEGGGTYILSLGTSLARRQDISPLYEFAAPITNLDTEIIHEHSSELSIDALLGMS